MAGCSVCGKTLNFVLTDREDGFGTEMCPYCNNVIGGAQGVRYMNMIENEDLPQPMNETGEHVIPTANRRDKKRRKVFWTVLGIAAITAFVALFLYGFGTSVFK